MNVSIIITIFYFRESCQLHYEDSPLKILSSEGAYLIDDMGNKLLDCATRMSHGNRIIVL
jgi:4-aminobutyrate aminotransferase-like enzyme